MQAERVFGVNYFVGRNASISGEVSIVRQPQQSGVVANCFVIF